MDLNLVILGGRLAAAPERVVSDSSQPGLRLLVAVRSEMPTRRLDVVPVWVPESHPRLEADVTTIGARLWITCRVQRRFSDQPHGRSSRLELVALRVAATPAAECATVG